MPKKLETSRQCAISRQERPVADLLRFAVSPEGLVLPDVDAKAPGRGVWITLSKALVEAAVSKNVFARSLKHKVEIPQDLALMADARLEQRLLGALGLARKAGHLVTGATKVRSAIDRGDVLALFTATDAASDGRKKMLAAFKSAHGDETPQHFELLGSEQMGLVLGRENVIHAALIAGPAAKGALFRAEQLARYRGIKPM